MGTGDSATVTRHTTVATTVPPSYVTPKQARAHVGTADARDQDPLTAALTTAPSPTATQPVARLVDAADALDQERGHRRTDDDTVDAFNDVLNE